ncbi:MAG TPA: DUF58 domain-containing protein [Polyangiaceae bacterium]
MQAHPARTSVDLAIAGLGVMAVGLVLREAAILGWGGALLVGLAIARAVTVVDVAKIRAAGFEMTWRGEPRRVRVARGEHVTLEAELRNRDGRAASFSGLRAVASPELDVTVEPADGEVPASGRLRVELTVRAERVGRHAIHGLSLELEGPPGLFEVPLTFANPYGIEVLPGSCRGLLRTARGGRSRRSAEQGRPGPLAGEGDSLRELREHQPGDPFRRIAWKPSARRAQLLVREYEREERDVVWIVLDASVELWAGAPGSAALDRAVDEAWTIADRHLKGGDFVGLAVVAARTLSWIEPGSSPGHAIKIATALAHATSCLDPDRSGLDEADVVHRVLEHLRPLDPRAAAGVRASDPDRLARRADRTTVARAPFRGVAVAAPARRERILRRYLGAFGMGSPPRLEPDRPRSDLEIGRVLGKLARERRRPSLVYLWSPPPDPATRPTLEKSLQALPKRRFELRWISMPIDTGIPSADRGLSRVVGQTVGLRARAALVRGEQSLRRLGVRIEGQRTRGREGA